MILRITRVLFAIEFLLAVPAVFTVWSQVGGQYHLDLMFWPWKFGLGLGAATLFTMLTVTLVCHEGRWSRRAHLFGFLLLVVILTAGAVTYYYHLHEPSDEDDQDSPATITKFLKRS